MKNKASLESYKSTNVEGNLIEGDPYKVILLMKEEIINNLVQAKRAIRKNDVQERLDCLNRAIKLVKGLQSLLDPEKGGEIILRYQSLYQRMVFRIIQANINGSIEILDELITGMSALKKGWLDIRSSI
jgi:flagellar protein FliS